MNKYFKKISIAVSIIMAISFISIIICLPLGIRDTMNNVNTLLSSTQITPKKIMINADVDTIRYNQDHYNYYSDIMFKQSKDNTAYIEIYTDELLNHNTIDINYPTEQIANIMVDRNYGNFTLDRNLIVKSIIKDLQSYPDAIVYLPKNINLDLKNPYMVNDGIEYNNKMDLKKQYDEKIAAENSLNY